MASAQPIEEVAAVATADRARGLSSARAVGTPLADGVGYVGDGVAGVGDLSRLSGDRRCPLPEMGPFE